MDDNEPRWLTIDEVLVIQAAQIKVGPGLPGLIDVGLVDSAVNKPLNRFRYEHEDDLLLLAVRLGVGIARNHGFHDGNKRTGMVAMIAFLAVNGYDLIMNDDTLLGRMIEACLTHDMTEEQMAEDLDGFVYDRPE